MSTTQINKLQVRRAKWHSGLTDMNRLHKGLLTKPGGSNAVAAMMGSKFAVSFITEALGNSYTTMSNETYEWKMLGNTRKAINIIGSNIPAGNPNAGQYGAEFEITVDEDYFTRNDVVRFESGVNGLHGIVVDEPVFNDGAYILRLRLITSDPTQFVPASALDSGSKLTFVSTAYPEYSEGGSSKSTEPIWFQNNMTIFRKSYTVTGSAATEVAIFEMQVGTKKVEFWCLYEEYLLLQEFLRERDYWLTYGNRNVQPDGTVALKGSNGRPIKTGAGLLDQIAYSNQASYTNLTEDFLQEYLMHLQQQAYEAEGTNYVLVTGSGGIKEFNRAIRNLVNTIRGIDASSYFLKKEGKNYGFIGDRWRTYEGLLGTTITVAYNPAMDDPQTFSAIDPQTGFTQESYRMVFLDMGKYEGASNIELVSKGGNGINRSLIQRYESGMINPPGMKTPEGMSMASNGLDGCTMHLLSEAGIKVANPYSCGQLYRTYV